MYLFFSAATDEWVGGVDAGSLLTIEFSFELLPINFLFRPAHERGRDAETGQCTCDEVHGFLSPLQPPDQQFADIFVYGNTERRCLKSGPIRHPFS